MHFDGVLSRVMFHIVFNRDNGSYDLKHGLQNRSFTDEIILDARYDRVRITFI